MVQARENASCSALGGLNDDTFLPVSLHAACVDTSTSREEIAVDAESVCAESKAGQRIIGCPAGPNLVLVPALA